MGKYAKRIKSRSGHRYGLYESGKQVGESTFYAPLTMDVEKVHRESLEKKGYKIRKGVGDFRGGEKMKIVKAKIKKANFKKVTGSKPPNGRKIKLPV